LGIYQKIELLFFDLCYGIETGTDGTGTDGTGTDGTGTDGTGTDGTTAGTTGT
jgi:hypothetical protein